jgi:hypothetical protein
MCFTLKCYVFFSQSMLLSFFYVSDFPKQMQLYTLCDCDIVVCLQDATSAFKYE